MRVTGVPFGKYRKSLVRCMPIFSSFKRMNCDHINSKTSVVDPETW